MLSLFLLKTSAYPGWIWTKNWTWHFGLRPPQSIGRHPPLHHPHGPLKVAMIDFQFLLILVAPLDKCGSDTSAYCCKDLKDGDEVMYLYVTEK